MISSLIQPQVKTGFIALWSGPINTVPSGWQTCDGTNGTPDLTGKFVIGAGGAYAVSATGGTASTDYSHSHSLSSVSTNSVAHSHTASATLSSAPNHTHSITQATGTAGATASFNTGTSTQYTTALSGHTHTLSTTSSASGAHSHTAVSTSTDSVSHSHTLSATSSIAETTYTNLPQYINLIYIMKL